MQLFNAQPNTLQPSQTAETRDRKNANPAEAAAFAPWMAYMADQRARQQATRDVAEANRLAQARERVTDSDLRRADATVNRARPQGPQAAPRDGTPAPSAGPLHEPSGPAPANGPGSALGASNPSPTATAPTSAPQGAALNAGHAAHATSVSAPGHDPRPSRIANPSGSGGANSALHAATASVSGHAANVRGAAQAGNAQTGSDGHGAAQARSGAGRVAPQASRETPPSKSLTPVETRKAVGDVLRVLKARTTPGRAVVKLQLSPPELGRLTIDLRLQRDSMQIRIVTESAAVRDAIQGSAGFLSEALQELGLSVERLEVEVQDDSTAGRHRDEASQNPANAQSGQRQVFADGDGKTEDVASDSERQTLESRLEAELPADVFIPGRVDITV